MTLEVNWKEAERKYTNRANILTKNGFPIGVEMWRQTMPLKFIDLNSPLAVAVNCDNRRIMGKSGFCHYEILHTGRLGNTFLSFLSGANNK